MIAESSTTSTLTPSETKSSVLITISTPGIETAICRLGNSEEVVRGLSVKELIQRVTSPSSLFSVGVPISQLQAESAASLAINELLAAECCDVVLPGAGATLGQKVSLDQLARSVAREHVGTQGNRFLNINLEVRSAADAVAPTSGDRRQVPLPPAVEVAEPRPIASIAIQPKATAAKPGWPPMPSGFADSPETEFVPPVATGGEVTTLDFSVNELSQPESAVIAPKQERSPTPDQQDLSISPGLAPSAAAKPATSSILTIVAEKLKEEPKVETRDRKEYARKSDWLRAQFLPEVEALDFSGLFVGNLGFGIREEKTRRNVVLADPARITEVLLRANGHRRSGEHAKALICYQELVDMDGSNADFRFLLGKTLLALGQNDEAARAFLRAKELGHDGAEKELSELKHTGHRPRATLGFLRFWKQ